MLTMLCVVVPSASVVACGAPSVDAYDDYFRPVVLVS